MGGLDLRRGFNRLAALLAATWAVYWLLIVPIQAGRAIQRHYEGDIKYCWEMYGSARQPDPNWLRDCKANSEQERQKGLYTGFGFQMEQGKWSYLKYWRDDGPWLSLMIVIPSLLAYGLAWTIAILCRWIWRGFRTSHSAT
jgi:hypothetical protein